jgi:hypothetical protein
MLSKLLIRAAIYNSHNRKEFEPSQKRVTFQLIYTYILLLLLLLLLLFTAIGLSPGGSSPTLVQTKIKIHKTTTTTTKLQNIKNIKQQNNYKIIKISTQTEYKIHKENTMSDGWLCELALSSFPYNRLCSVVVTTYVTWTRYTEYINANNT